MNLRSIILYLSRKLPSVMAIHGDAVAMLRFDAGSYATVIHWLREIVFVSAVEKSHESPPTRNRDEVNDVILLALVK
jgi:hypothetical protein